MSTVWWSLDELGVRRPRVWDNPYEPTQRYSHTHRDSSGIKAPSEEEEFHAVSLLFSFKRFVPNSPLFSLLILLFSATTPDGRPHGGACVVYQTSLCRKACIHFGNCVAAACIPVDYLLVVLPCIWIIHFESLLVSLELKGRTRTATFTEPDMFAV